MKITKKLVFLSFFLKVRVHGIIRGVGPARPVCECHMVSVIDTESALKVVLTLVTSSKQFNCFLILITPADCAYSCALFRLNY